MKKQKKSPIAALLLAVLLLLPAGCGVQGGAADTPPSSAQQTEGKDQYQTDPVPDGKPAPVEPDDAAVDTGTQLTCTISISCATILDNWDKCADSKKPLVPDDGVLLPATEVTFSQGESVYDVLQRVCRENKIHMESSFTPVYNSAYIEGIGNLYEFDAAASPAGCTPSTAGIPTTAARGTSYRTATRWSGSTPVIWGRMWAAASPVECGAGFTRMGDLPLTWGGRGTEKAGGGHPRWVSSSCTYLGRW